MDYYIRLENEKAIIMNELLLKETEETIENFILEYKIDVNYDDGSYLETIYMMHDINLLKMMKRNNADFTINNSSELSSSTYWTN